MQLRRAAASAAVVFLSIFLFLLPSTSVAHNITRILEKDPQFSTFNHYLTATHLASDINERETITVCVVDNAGMADLLSKHLSLDAIRNVLSFHVFLDYFDSKKLHDITNGSALTATMYQATGEASGSSGFVNITEMKGGKVGFSPKDDGGEVSATFVEQVQAIPYNISVIQISKILPSSQAEAPAPEPSKVNLTALMWAHGCKVFAETLSANSAQKTFDDNINSGLTIFCPGDNAMKSFMPKYKNLSADSKQLLLEYHGVPVYQTISDLRSSNGLTNTLATEGNKYTFTVQNDGTTVTIKTKIVTSKIVNTLTEKPSVAIHQLDKVLIPAELTKASPSPSPSPAPAPGPEADAESPKAPKRHKSPPAPAAPADSPADAPDGDVADQDANPKSNGAVEFKGGRFAALILSLWFVFQQL